MIIPDYIHFTTEIDSTLSQLINRDQPDKIAVLTDENTEKFCLPKLKLNAEISVLKIVSGEHQKTIATCEEIWRFLTEKGFSRNSLLINLGGGVIGDMGGFASATFKRGIRFYTIPTTLLSQVDASIGGKLGVDFEGLKNHIGCFKNPDAVILDSTFLETLSSRELKSGFAEVIKHALIRDADYWQRILTENYPSEVDWEFLLKKNVEIKNKVVTEDPTERGLRKILNFGHTLGHAIETWYLDQKEDLLHGEAVACGMILESHLSYQLDMIDKSELDQISNFVSHLYKSVTIPQLSQLQPLLKQDKKNTEGKVNFSLLQGIGQCAWDRRVTDEMIGNAIEYYNSIK
ncbi:MAG: 3-dehydroquinate synthase [Cyclobacteriaceae bacterium]|nr:3-dehydroquinate synthase [Cyclobacteriaceae bacterium HetDA_MAG_MS6]